ncbi:MAG: hypothetical protein LCH92_08220 [Proteobacteria bacterium]|nr:hypothetical protein [Pseudomonadota bacterium]
MSGVIRIHGGPRQAEALENLVGLIEAGRLVLQDLGVNSRAFPVEIFDGEAMTLHTIIAAYHGSLDAAKALHGALLPGYTRDVDATAPECGIRVSIWSPSGPIVGVGDTEIEARAWLLAILHAYRGTLA